MASARLTEAQRKALRNIREHGEPAPYGMQTMQHYGGLSSTMYALQRRGLVDEHWQLTDAGKEAAQF